MIGEAESQGEELGPRWGLEPRLLAILAALLLVLAGLGIMKVWLSSSQQALAQDSPPQSESVTATKKPEPQLDPLVVYVSGAVVAPGVVEMEPGKRVVDAIEAAGGPTDAAAVESLNLARPLVDGEQLHLPENTTTTDAIGGEANAGTTATGPACVDINQSASAQLQTLSGIGPALAERIIQHRETSGPFVGNEALMEVSGIGPKIFAGLEADLCG